jgi:hypothetical protein
VVTTWEELQAACRPALADVERSRPGLLHIGPPPEGAPATDHWGNEVPLLFLWDRHRSGTGLWLGHPGEEFSDALYRASEVIQEAAIEAVHGAWPECPDHPDSHPLELHEAGTELTWACPAGGRRVATVGELSPPGAPVSQ